MTPSPGLPGLFLFLHRFSPGIPLPLTVNAAAVLLAVKVQWLGQMAAVGIALTEVGVIKRNAMLSGYFFADFLDNIVFLMGAYE